MVNGFKVVRVEGIGDLKYFSCTLIPGLQYRIGKRTYPKLVEGPLAVFEILKDAVAFRSITDKILEVSYKPSEEKKIWLYRFGNIKNTLMFDSWDFYSEDSIYSLPNGTRLAE